MQNKGKNTWIPADFKEGKNNQLLILVYVLMQACSETDLQTLLQ